VAPRENGCVRFLPQKSRKLDYEKGGEGGFDRTFLHTCTRAEETGGPNGKKKSSVSSLHLGTKD